jgi:hypothetical protein
VADAAVARHLLPACGARSGDPNIG